MKTVIAAITLTLAFILGVVSPAEAHGRGSTTVQIPRMMTQSGLVLQGSITCSSLNVYAENPNGERALLLIVPVGSDVPLASIVDYGSTIKTQVEVSPLSYYQVSIGGSEDGDSIRLTVVTPACDKVKKDVKPHHWLNFWINHDRRR